MIEIPTSIVKRVSYVDVSRSNLDSGWDKHWLLPAFLDSYLPLNQPNGAWFGKGFISWVKLLTNLNFLKNNYIIIFSLEKNYQVRRILKDLFFS